MATILEGLYDELAQRNEKLTVQVRTLTLGLLAFIAGILGGILGFGSKDPHPTLPHWVEVNLLLVATLLFTVLLIDLWQAVLSLEFVGDTIDDAEYQIEQKELTADAEVLFDYSKPKYVWSWRLFWIKSRLLAVGTIWFAALTIVYCIQHLR